MSSLKLVMDFLLLWHNKNVCLIKFIEWASRVLYFNRCKWSKYVCKANIIDNVFANTLNYDIQTKYSSD